MTALVHDNLQDLKPWRVRLPNPFLMAMLVLCALIYAIYCLNINIPTYILPLWLVIVMPFFRKTEFLALGACLPLISGFPHFRTILIFAVILILIRYYRSFKIGSVYWIVLGFVSIELFNALNREFFEWSSYIGWAGNLFYFALCISLIKEVQKEDLLQVMKYYVVTFCCIVTTMLQRFIIYVGDFSAILSGFVRLGDVKDASGGIVAEGLSFNPNVLGILCILCIGICLVFLYLKQPRRWLWLGIGCYATMLGFMTLSRAYMLCFLTLIVIFYFDFESWRKNPWIIPAAMVLVGMLFVLYGISDNFALMVDNVFKRFEMHDITAGRVDLWYEWNKFYLDNPSVWLTGIGSNGSNTPQGSMGITGIFNVSHNALQEGYIYWGAIGLVLLIYLQFAIYRTCKETNSCGLCRFNYALMMAFCLSIMSGQYLSGNISMQIIPAVVMAYPFWRDEGKDGV